MELLIFLGFSGGFWVLRTREQRQRIALLSRHLAQFDIEKLMETLLLGYMRALGEENPERQAQVWEHLRQHEERLSDQFQQFSKSFGGVWADDALISTLPISFPRSTKIWPRATFDARAAFAIHAQGISDATLQSDDLTAKERAFRLSAEMLLMQHTCHWFCRSKTVASARLLARHQTHYQQALDAVSLSTRQKYLALTKSST
jgi:hypothetical protein